MLLPFMFINTVGFNSIICWSSTFVTAKWPIDLTLKCQVAPNCLARQSTTSIPTLCRVPGRQWLPKPTTYRNQNKIHLQWHKGRLNFTWNTCLGKKMRPINNSLQMQEAILAYQNYVHFSSQNKTAIRVGSLGKSTKEKKTSHKE